MSAGPEHLRLIRKLESIAELCDADREALATLPFTIRSLAADADLVREGDRPAQCCLILEGFACRHQSTQEGRRQILSFYIPGDMPDLQSLYLNVNDYSLGALVPTKVALIGHRPMFDLFDGHPRLKDVFWRDTLIDAAVTRRWILNVGRREAYARAAHLLCELYVRHEVVGLAKDFSFGLPLTQTELGDALGISTVHANRSLQALRADGLITLKGGLLTIEDWDGLVLAGEFDPAYLHLSDRGRQCLPEMSSSRAGRLSGRAIDARRA